MRCRGQGGRTPGRGYRSPRRGRRPRRGGVRGPRVPGRPRRPRFPPDAAPATGARSCGSRRGRGRPPRPARRPAAGAPATSGRSARLQRAARSGSVGPAADHHTRQVEPPAAQFPRRQLRGVERAEPRRRHHQHRRAQQPRPRPPACRPPSSNRTSSPPAPSTSTRSCSVASLAAASATSCGRTGARPARRAAVAGANGSGIPGEFDRRHGTGQPRHLVGVPGLVRAHARLRGLEHGDRPARRAAPSAATAAVDDRLADLRARARDHQYRHLIPPAPPRTPRGRSVPRPRRP